MSEELLIIHCSPTLAGLKTGNLFNCPYENIDNLNYSIKEQNDALNIKGIYILVLGFTNSNALIYVYRRKLLTKDISKKETKNLLLKLGYNCKCIDDCIYHLSERIERYKEFPHEIGIFLGYPISDVRGFIENNGKNFKTCGFWKVYDNEQLAEKKFAQFRKCSELYKKHFLKGKSIFQLAITK